ncbi:multidrug efflux SMR transporter [Corynebacterium felinum]|uniref:Small multidrug resistance pump n=1 Tax=Corynebacterium felinum TaxID=131318 RepID=A0ABU2B502_9CORY|nr:multidrug efflux SMR transporter [Corynebacterium felinum]MDF5820327.1 multidrug efflux SMR transporter [Corynebacterium felinum]MDR7353694.1 small multidrug resistance pump [Corynebacterium felinum]WJY95873.1 Spermidine export protein MdtJ [Corynebacterium felinum]
MNKWFILAIAVVAEVCATLLLKAALQSPVLYLIVVAGYVISYGALAVLLRRGVPLGVAYGIWGACGVALTALFGFILYDEPLSPLSSVGIAFIIAGIALVETGSHPKVATQ